MAFCGQCGAKLEDGAKFCQACGQPSQGADVKTATAAPPRPAETPDAKDAADNKVMAILAYIIVLIPLFAAPKDSKFARYHTNQGLILLLAAIAYAVCASVLSTLLFFVSWALYLVVATILRYAALAFLAFCVIGILNAVKGEMKPLPIIGHFRILK